MKKVLRKDFKSVISPVVMMAVALVALECLVLAGVGMRNPKLISNTIVLAIYAAAISLVYHLFLSGSLFLKNLRERPYFYDLDKNGVSKYSVVIWKILYVFLSIVVFAALYIGALYWDLGIFSRAFPDQKKEFAKFGVKEMIQGKNKDAFAPALAATVFEYLTAGLMLVALVFAVVAVTYSVFRKSRLCGFNCVLLYLIMFGAFMKVYAATIAGSTGTKAHVRAGLMQLVMIAFFTGVALYMMRSVVPKDPSQDL